jgi:hypothetical protein
VSGCGTAAHPAVRTDDQLVWRNVGVWSGHTSMQTESFLNESGALRIAWEARAESPGEGSFRATFHSAVSGRPLATVIESRGTAHGASIVPEDPRPMYVEVEANGVAWRFALEEGFAAVPAAPIVR